MQLRGGEVSEASRNKKPGKGIKAVLIRVVKADRQYIFIARVRSSVRANGEFMSFCFLKLAEKNSTFSRLGRH